MRGIVKGLALIIPFWVAAFYVMAVNGWMGYFFAAIGALCLILVMGTVIGVAYEWRKNARQNQQEPHSLGDCPSPRPDDRGYLHCKCNE